MKFRNFSIIALLSVIGIAMFTVVATLERLMLPGGATRQKQPFRRPAR